MTELELFDKLNPKRDLPQATCDVISQVYKVMQEENEQLEAQIEKMSNCLNCTFWKDKKYNVCREIKKLGKTCCTFWKLRQGRTKTMLWILFGIAFVLMIIGLLVDEEDFTIGAGIVTAILLIPLCISLYSYNATKSSADKKIAVLEQKKEVEKIWYTPSEKLPKNLEEVLLRVKLHDKWNREVTLKGFRHIGECRGEYDEWWGYCDDVHNVKYDFVDGEEVIAWAYLPQFEE